MGSKKMIVLFYSGQGNTERMANIIAETVKKSAIEVTVQQVDQFDLSLLPSYDAVVLGSPTYFSNLAWPVKKLVDESIVFYRRNELKGKVAGIFTSSGTERDGKDCLTMLELALGFHHGMKVVPGIVRPGSEKDEMAKTKCQEYGKSLAEAVLKG